MAPMHGSSTSVCGAEQQHLRCWLPAAGFDDCHATAARQLRPEVDGRAEGLGGRRNEAARHLLRDLRPGQGARHAPPQPALAPLPHRNSAPVLTARLRAAYRWLIGPRAAGAASARQELLQRQAAPGETLGSSKEGASRHERTQQPWIWTRSAVLTAAASRFLPV